MWEEYLAEPRAVLRFAIVTDMDGKSCGLTSLKVRTLSILLTWNPQHLVWCVAFGRCLVTVVWLDRSLGKKGDHVGMHGLFGKPILTVQTAPWQILLRATSVPDMVWPVAGRTERQVCPQDEDGDDDYD